MFNTRVGIRLERRGLKFDKWRTRPNDSYSLRPEKASWVKFRAYAVATRSPGDGPKTRTEFGGEAVRSLRSEPLP